MPRYFQGERKMELKEIAHMAILCLCVFIASGCNLPHEEKPPYAISKPLSAVGSKDNCYTFAGIEFELYNASDREIKTIEVSCTVYGQ